MKTRILTVITVTILLLVAQASLLVSARAQVPGIINYQGRVIDAGTNFNGTGQFKFALVNGSAGTTNYWSNNGTTTGQPAAAVSLSVTKGLYSVLLGDTTLANMTTAIPSAVFTNSDVRLRVWFSDGSGFQQLSPDQRLAASGYAMSAATVPGGAITSAQLASNLTISGSFSAGSISLNGVPFLYTVAYQDSFVGGSGNPTMSGDENTADGVSALLNNTTGQANTANGVQALYANTTGSDNTATGNNALEFNSSGYENTATGFQALDLNGTGSDNAANGVSALYFNSTGGSNTANGAYALYSNTNGIGNVADGFQAHYSNKSGRYNTALGFQALYGDTAGEGNTAVGSFTLSIASGDFNIAIGDGAGEAITTGNDNIDIGNLGNAGDSRVIRIGDSVGQSATYIAGISGVTISPSGAAVFVNTNGQLGTVNSSLRFKQDIRDMGNQSDVLLALHPVAFRYKPDLDPQGLPQFGLIAEEVEKVAPELVLRDAQGEVYTVRYEQINAMLLNEFQKEHRQIQTLGEQKDAQIAELRQQNNALEKRLAQMEKRLQQVSDQIEQSKAPPLQTSNNQANGGF
jgi:hypothetical protein